MRVAYFSVEASTLAWQRRIFDEGTPILVYHKELYRRKVGEGIVPIARTMDEWLAFGNADPDTIWFFDCTSTSDYDSGALADRLRKMGKLVVGGGTFMDRLEKDRIFGEKLAAQCEVQTPPAKTFSNVGAAIAFLRSNPQQTVGDGGWAWKSNKYLGAANTFVAKNAQKVIDFLERMIVPQFGSNISCILQERVPGVALSTAQWWNGRSFVGPIEGTLERKKFMNGDCGPATGCSLNIVWFYREEWPKIARALNWDRVARMLRENNAPPGLYDINAIVNRQGAWFLEWTPRLGIDSELTSQRGISSLTELLKRLALGGDVADLFDIDQCYMSVRLSVPPYPTEVDIVEKMALAKGVPLSGLDGIWQKKFVGVGIARTKLGFDCVDPFGFVGVALTANTSLTAGFKDVYHYVEKVFDAPNLQYRTDAEKVIRADIQEMAELGWLTTDILDVGEDE